MEETISGLRERFPNVQIRGSVCYGDLPDGVAGFCAANGKPFMVVVGNSTTGDHGGWLDNHLMELIRRVEVPVVAVPPEVTYHGVANMCFAWDGGGHDVGAALRYLRILVPRHQAKLHVLTTDPDGRNQDNVPQADGTVLQALRPLSPHHHYIYNATLEGALDHFLTENNIDWLVVIPRHRSFWAGLFHRSHTRQLAHRVHLPLVALPEVAASVQD
jgi:nucleotide-binding universal stress UspA family protein